MGATAPTSALPPTPTPEVVATQAGEATTVGTEATGVVAIRGGTTEPVQHSTAMLKESSMAL